MLRLSTNTPTHDWWETIIIRQDQSTAAYADVLAKIERAEAAVADVYAAFEEAAGRMRSENTLLDLRLRVRRLGRDQRESSRRAA